VNPYISIIIPSFNRVRLLRETINSVRFQSFKNWECIIIDDGSTEENFNTIKTIIQDDFRFSLIQRRSKFLKGPSSCRNIGIIHARANFMMFLDSDDILSKDCLEYRVNKARSAKDFDLWIFSTHSFVNIMDHSILFNNIPVDNIDESFFYKKHFLNGKTPFTVISVLWRSEALRKLKGFDSSFLRYEDPELHTRAFLADLRSFTDKSKKKDTFYRNGKRFKKSEHQKLEVLESRYKFAIKFARFIRKERTSYFVNTLRSFAYPYNSKKYIIRFLYLGLKTKNLDIKFIIKALILFQYHLFSLNKKRGFGYHRVRRWTFS